jgi:hypothetical protein
LFQDALRARALWKNWKRSSFDSIVIEMGTGASARPKELVPLQIARGTAVLD